MSTTQHDITEQYRTEFVHFLHEIARQIAQRAESGMSQKDQVIAAANVDLLGFCQRYFDEYDRREFAGPSVTIRREHIDTIVRMLAYAMIHQHEFDVGKAETFEQRWSRWGEEDQQPRKQSA